VLSGNSILAPISTVPKIATKAPAPVPVIVKKEEPKPAPLPAKPAAA